MKVAGFTFVRNAVLYDYPVVEAVQSILPVCDLLVIAVGHSEDGTLELVRNIQDPKIRIIETVWDDMLRQGGRVLAVETNKAFDAIPADYDWCFYIQADECVHEQDLPGIRQAMEHYLNDRQTEGLLFNYRHFYGSYDYVGISRRWYRREVRIIRNDKHIRSWRDAQGFRWDDNRKLRVRYIGAYIHHYGWVKHPAAQQLKQLSFNKLWHSDQTVEAMVYQGEQYIYNGAEPLARFTESHPAVMLPRVRAVNWKFEGDPTRVARSWKETVSAWMENTTGWRPGEYKNYRLIT